MHDSVRREAPILGTDGPELLAELNELTEEILYSKHVAWNGGQFGPYSGHDAAGYSSLPAFLMQTNASHAPANNGSTTPNRSPKPSPHRPLTRPAPGRPRSGPRRRDRGEHLEVIAKRSRPASSVSVADRDVVEQSLTDYARTAPPTRGAKRCEPGVASGSGRCGAAAKSCEPKNGAWSRTHGGRMQLTADLDKEAADALAALFDTLGPLTAPIPHKPKPRRRAGRVIHGAATATMLVALD